VETSINIQYDVASGCFLLNPVSPTFENKNGADGMESFLFVQQPRTEKQIGNVDSAVDVFARTICSRQFK
jgi:hypothetical protein